MTSDDQTANASQGRRRVLADVAALTIAGYLVQPIMFVSNLFTRGALGPFLAGTFATLGLVQQYTQLLNLGVLQAAERQIPFFRGANDTARCERIRVTSLTLAVLSGVVIGLGLLGYALYARSTLEGALYRGLLVFVGVVLLTQWSQGYLAFLRSDLRFQYLARNNVLFMLLTGVGNVAGTILFGFNGLLAWTLFMTALGCVAYTRAAGLVRPRLSTVLTPEAKSLIAAGLPFLLVSFCHMGVHTMDNVMVLRLLGTEALGTYTLALSAGNVIYSFANSVSQVLYPRMQEEHGRVGGDDVVLRFLARPTQLLASILPILIAPLFFFLPVAIAVFIPKFVPGIPSFRIIMIGVSLYALIQIPRLCLISLGRMKELMGWSVLTVATCVALAYPLSRWGLSGIALSACVAYFVGLVGPMASLLRKRERTRSIVAIIALTVAPTCYAAVTLGLIQAWWPASGLGETPSLLRGGIEAFVKTLVFLAAYVPLLLVYERYGGLLRDYVRPIWRRGLARAKGAGSGS